jgi:cobyrinic acid a,c-diamide synthase
VDPDRDARFAFELARGKGIEGDKDGIYCGNATGTYTHSYFSSKFTDAFVDAATRFASR